MPLGWPAWTSTDPDQHCRFGSDDPGLREAVAELIVANDPRGAGIVMGNADLMQIPEK
jgi:hypothetical protein